MRNVMMKGLVAILCLLIMAGGANAGRWFKVKERKEPVTKKSVLVFPFDIASETQVPATVSKDLADAAKDSLQKNSALSVIVYSDKLSAIQRAIQIDRSLNQKEADGPYSEDKEKAMKIAKTCNADYFLAGAVDAYSFDSEKKIVSVTLSAQLYDVKTGMVINAFSATGKNNESDKASNVDGLAGIAMADAIKKLELEKVKVTENSAAASTNK